MIKLTTLLKEIEFGKQLFGDPKDSGLQATPAKFKQFLAKYNAEVETNSQEEANFLSKLKQYFSSNSTEGVDVKVLQDLLALKSNFPYILDPKESGNTKAFRGATIPVEDLLKMPFQFDGNGVYQAVNPSYTYTSKNTSGFLSFTDLPMQAENFTRHHAGTLVLTTSNTFPVILECSISNPNLLFNTEFTSLISPFSNEEEMIYVGRSLKPAAIYITIANEIFSNFANLKWQWPLGYQLKEKLDSIKPNA